MALSTEKWVSINQSEARENKNKLTAGEAAAYMTKTFAVSPKISAKEIRPFAKEWHHAGFYRPSSGGKKTMGKTWFFRREELTAELHARLLAVREAAAIVTAQPERTAYTVNEEWTSASGRYGKRQYFKVVRFGRFTTHEKKVPNEITIEQYEASKHREGERLPAYTSAKSVLS